MNEKNNAAGAKYLRTHGNKCPYCNSDNLWSADYVATENGPLLLECGCTGCGATWVDRYALVNVVLEKDFKEAVKEAVNEVERTTEQSIY